MENTENWLKILIRELKIPSTAEFCRRADLKRGLVDKLSKDMHSPRLDTLKKIKQAFPETDMNWLISGRGKVLVDVKDDNEMKLLEQYRLKIKSDVNQRLADKFYISLDYFVQDQNELDELEKNATARDIKDRDLAVYRMELFLFQHRRRIVSELLSEVPKGGTIFTGPKDGLKEQYSEILDHLNYEIFKTIKFFSDDIDKKQNKTDEVEASENPLNEKDDVVTPLKTSDQIDESSNSDFTLDEELIHDAGQDLNELLEYTQKMGEFDFADKE